MGKRITLESIRDKEMNNISEHTCLAGDDLARAEECLASGVDAVVYAMKMYEKGVDQEYLAAFLRLAAKCIANAESIFWLTKMGWYGSAFALFRSLYVDISMLWYLHYQDHLVGEWLAEEGDTFQKNRDFRDKFAEATVLRYLAEHHADHTTTQVFNLFSKSVHGSAFGVRFYTVNNRVAWEPEIEPGRTRLLLLWLGGMTLDLLSILLEREAFKKFYHYKYGAIAKKHEQLFGRNVAVANEILANAQI